MQGLRLASRTFDVAFDPKSGTIQELTNPLDHHKTNFVVSAKHAPKLDVQDSRFLGDLVLHVKRKDEESGATMTTGLSSDTRTIHDHGASVTIAYTGHSQNDGGLHGLALTTSFGLAGPSGNILDWTIKITNTSSEDLEVEDLGLPLLMNSYWGNDQTSNYEQRVHRHSFVGLHGSYIYWQRPNGEGPTLVMTPHTNTSLEFKQRFRDGEAPFGEDLPHWEGLTEFYVHSKHVSKVRADKARQYLPATSRTLQRGGSCEYGFSFAWADGYQDLHDILYASGGFDIISMPGMVVPTNLTATMAVRCTSEITSVSSHEGLKVSPAGSSKNYKLFKLSFDKLGEHQVTISTADSRSTVLQYYCIEPIVDLIKKRTQFLIEHQLAESKRGYDGAFLQWDMTRQRLITWDDYPEESRGGWKEWMAGGSDDLGLAPAAFMTEKCLVFPKQNEITAVDYHIDHFLFNYLITAKDAKGELTYQVYRWYDGQDGTPEDTGIWRCYNYTHIANTLLNMYRIATAYPRLTFRRGKDEYLHLAYEIVNAMYTKIALPNPIGDAANTLGLMGESTVVELIDTLNLEGKLAEADTLRSYVDRKMRYFKDVKYPFASEQTIDTTGFEAVYTFAKLHNDKALVEKCQKASLASRGLQPLWYYYGSDNRMMGEAYWNLGYETQLGAWQQQDYLVNFSKQADEEFADSMRSTYGAYLAGWANINSGQIDPNPANIGAAAWQYQSEGGMASWPFMPLVGSWWAWSGEADLGFWGALRTACVNVVHDPIVGLYAYGGEVELVDGKYYIEPKDGVQRRFCLFTIGNLGVSIDNARYSRAVVSEDGSSIELSVKNNVAEQNTAIIKLSNAVDGEYKCYMDGDALENAAFVVNGCTVVFNLPEQIYSQPYQVRIERN